MDNQIYNLPKCECCGKDALGKIHTALLCGECIIKWNKQQIEKKAKQKMELINEIKNGN